MFDDVQRELIFSCSHMAKALRTADTPGPSSHCTVEKERLKRRTRMTQQHTTQRRCLAEARAYTSENLHRTHKHTQSHNEAHGHTQANARTGIHTYTHKTACAPARASCFVADCYIMQIVSPQLTAWPKG